MMIEIPETAADAIVEAANAYGCSPAQYIEALLHYAISRHKRAGLVGGSDSVRPPDLSAPGQCCRPLVHQTAMTTLAHLVLLLAGR